MEMTELQRNQGSRLQKAVDAVQVGGLQKGLECIKKNRAGSMALVDWCIIESGPCNGGRSWDTEFGRMVPDSSNRLLAAV